MRDGVTPQMFYRIEIIQRSDGTTYESLQYQSECGTGQSWMASMEPDYEKFIKNRLIKI